MFLTSSKKDIIFSKKILIIIMFFGFEHAKNGIKLLHNSSISDKNKVWVENLI